MAFPQFTSEAQIKSLCDSGLAGAAQRLTALEKRAVDKGWVAAYDDFYAAQEDAQNAIDFSQYVNPDKALRDAAQACALRWADFNSSLGQNEKLYRAMKKAPTSDAIERELVRVIEDRLHAASLISDAMVRLGIAGNRREQPGKSGSGRE